MKISITIILLAVSTLLIGQETRKISFFSDIEVAWLKGIGNVSSDNSLSIKNKENVFGLSFINGVKFNKPEWKKLRVGIGFGIEKWDKSLLFPVVFTPSFFVIDKESSPFVFGSIGYTIGSINSYTDGGLIYSAGLGYRHQLKKQFNLFFKLKFSKQNIEQSLIRCRENCREEKSTISYKFIGISFGIGF